MSDAMSKEIDRNLDRISELLPYLLPVRAGQYALMRHGAIVDFFDDALEAQIEGNRQFGDSIFSIQRVQDTADHLGYFSYAVDPRKT